MDVTPKRQFAHSAAQLPTGSLFCKNCGATLRPITSLVPPDTSDFKYPTISILKRIFRGIVTTIAVLAGVVFFFDKPVGRMAGIVFVASGVVLILCLLVWRIFDLGDNDWFQPKRTG